MWKVKDRNGLDLNIGDLVNVFYTSYDGEYNHDLVCEVSCGEMGDIQLKAKGLLWECHGHNQHPSSSTFCLDYKNLASRINKNGIYQLIIPNRYDRNDLHGTKWKPFDESFYIEKMPEAAEL